ncbi:MAG TPA: VTT domain-containing protein, partial [Longimicrobiaceae bacterium]|nr:VTT domain-containing protein [Longimicrobiaceae bacterium]
MEPPDVKHYLLILLAVCVALLALFGAATALGLPVLEDPTPWLGRGGVGTAALTTGLLWADVFIPVPSSLVMIANGVFFGVMGGTALTLLGAAGAAVVGYGVGRWGARSADRTIPAEERERARRLVERWGALAVVASRPVPILAEAVAIAAGLTGMPFGRFALAAVAG